VRPAALKETVTDAEAHYKIEGLPAGECVVMAMSKDKGRGYATVTVVAEKHTDGVHIKLAQPAK
jgi:hypothetical protein